MSTIDDEVKPVPDAEEEGADPVSDPEGEPAENKDPDKTAIVTFLYHSGVMVAVKDTLLVFDYWRGESESALPEACRITQADFASYRQVLVFVSHGHPDHFDRIIFSWQKWHPNIHYILSDDITNPAGGVHLAPGLKTTLGQAQIYAFPSTDIGVSYYVRLYGINIFHAGDLNLWHWRDETPLSEVNRAEREFDQAIKPLENLKFDIVFFPVDPRMGSMYDAGANRFIMAFKPRVFIPIHWQERTEVAISYARDWHTFDPTRVIAMTKPREYASLVLRPKELLYNLSLPRGSMTEPNRPLGNNRSTLSPDNPFKDSDLPVILN